MNREPQIIDKGCPVCGAPAGDFCHTPSGKPRSDHKGREYVLVLGGRPPRREHEQGHR